MLMFRSEAQKQKPPFRGLDYPSNHTSTGNSDLGAGSTDASIINQKGEIVATHLAGAGDMVTMIIARELGLNDRYLAEEIKKYPLAKVESLFHLRHEDGSVQFFPTPLSPMYLPVSV